MKFIRSTFIIYMLLISNNIYALPTSKITVKIVDHLGKPIEGAKVGIGFSLPKERGEGWGSVSKGQVGKSDSDGLFTAEGETEPYVGFSGSKDGYYGSAGKFDSFTGISGFMGFRKYEPWNPTLTLMLKKIINPIPMYAVDMDAPLRGQLPEIPVLGQFVGFHLTSNDWVVPYGLGTHKDILFKVDIRRAESIRDYDVTMTVKFPNEGDGLIEYRQDTSNGKSLLRFPHNAPLSAYQPELVIQYKREPGKRYLASEIYQDPDINYFLRVRTEMDNNGNVIGGLYGKIHGPIRLSHYLGRTDNDPSISFNYYLNPNNNDTNIEFYPEKNLFENLPVQLKVTEP